MLQGHIRISEHARYRYKERVTRILLDDAILALLETFTRCVRPPLLEFPLLVE